MYILFFFYFYLLLFLHESLIFSTHTHRYIDWYNVCILLFILEYMYENVYWIRKILLEEKKIKFCFNKYQFKLSLINKIWIILCLYKSYIKFPLRIYNCYCTAAVAFNINVYYALGICIFINLLHSRYSDQNIVINWTTKCCSSGMRSA